MGAQGSGKSTQAKLLAEKLKLTHLSSGNISRRVAAEDTEDGKIFREALSKGLLAPDELLMKYIEEVVLKSVKNGGFVFDGWPRNKEQLVLLERLKKKYNIIIDKVIYVNLSDEEGMRRISERAKIGGRADDFPENVAQRLKIFHERTEPILEYFRQKGLLVEVDGSPTISEIHGSIMKLFNNEN